MPSPRVLERVLLLLGVTAALGASVVLLGHAGPQAVPATVIEVQRPDTARRPMRGVPTPAPPVVEPGERGEGLPRLAPRLGRSQPQARAYASLRAGRARVRALDDLLAATPGATARRRAVEEMASLVERLGRRMGEALQELVLDRLALLEDPALCWRLARALSRSGQDGVLAARIQARLEAGHLAPTTQAALVIALGGVGGPTDVAALRAFGPRAGPVVLPHAVRAAARLGGADARAFVQETDGRASTPDLRRALADARRVLASAQAGSAPATTRGAVPRH